MNKAVIDDLIPKAYTALEDFGIANNKGEIIKTFRGYISSFGAAIVMGSLRAAIAFNSKNKDTGLERNRLMMIIYYLVTNSKEDINSIKGTAL